MSRTLLIITWGILMQLKIAGQSKWGIENYNYLGIPGTSAIVPIIHFETKGKFYGELRYNYEAEQTVTVLGGRSFKKEGNLSFRITPQAGFSAGLFTGFTGAVRLDTEWKNFYFSSQTQQSLGTKKINDSFFFSWSELGYTVRKNFFAGAALQYTGRKEKKEFESGIVAGLNFKNFSFPCYLFKPFQQDSHIVLGINYEWSSGKRARS